MRYTDEGNLRFSGNTRTSSPNQGYYRSELDSGKYAVTLTGLEPGLGYLGFNADELTYDIDNHTLCTCNLEISGGICGNLNICGPIYADGLTYTIDNHTLCTCNLEICGEICGNLNVSGNITAGGYLCSCGELYVSDSIYGKSDLSLSGGLCLGAPGDVCIYDHCGHDVFCSYNGNLCIYGLQYCDDAYTSERSCIEVGRDSILIRRETNDGVFGISICSSDDLITFMGKPSSETLKFIDGKTIRTTSSCLELDNDVCVPDIFTIGSGSSTKCHYIHTVSLNNSTYTSTDGTINLGNITATVGLDGNSSFVVTNCSLGNRPGSDVIIGCAAGIAQDFDSRGSVAIGEGATIFENFNVAIGPFSCARCYSTSIGYSTYACTYALALGMCSTAKTGNVAIGRGAHADSSKFNYIVTRASSCVDTGASVADVGFGSTQLLVKRSTLECDLYNALEDLILKNINNTSINRENKDYLLLDKAIYRDEVDLNILGTGDYNTLIKYTSSDISIGNKMTVHKTCESAISLTCANSYEVWNILF